MDGSPPSGWSADAPRSLARPGQAYYGVVGGEDLVHRQRPLAVDHHEAPAAVVQAVDEQVDRLVMLAIEVDEDALSESDRVGQRHARAADLGPDADLHVHQRVGRQDLVTLGVGLLVHREVCPKLPRTWTARRLPLRP